MSNSQKFLPNAGKREANCIDKRADFLPNSAPLNGSESGGGLFPAGFFASSGPATAEINVAGERKEEP